MRYSYGYTPRLRMKFGFSGRRSLLFRLHLREIDLEKDGITVDAGFDHLDEGRAGGNLDIGELEEDHFELADEVPDLLLVGLGESCPERHAAVEELPRCPLLLLQERSAFLPLVVHDAEQNRLGALEVGEDHE